MKALDLLKLATEVYPELTEFYNEDIESFLDDYDGQGGPLADTVVTALLDTYSKHGGGTDSAMLIAAAKAMEALQQQIGKVRNRLIQQVVAPTGG